MQLEEADGHLQRTQQDVYVEQEHSTELESKVKTISKVETLQQTETKRVQLLEALSGRERGNNTQCFLWKETQDSVAQVLSHLHTQIISLDVNLGSQKDIIADSARELQLLKQQRFGTRYRRNDGWRPAQNPRVGYGQTFHETGTFECQQCYTSRRGTVPYSSD